MAISQDVLSAMPLAQNHPLHTITNPSHQGMCQTLARVCIHKITPVPPSARHRTALSQVVLAISEPINRLQQRETIMQVLVMETLWVTPLPQEEMVLVLVWTHLCKTNLWCLHQQTLAWVRHTTQKLGTVCLVHHSRKEEFHTMTYSTQSHHMELALQTDKTSHFGEGECKLQVHK